ncbi:MAG: protein translocase subunit SecD [Alphaproteobacteria bacterium]|nr:protein translocase subunit SecD [Alphaproteobacteria bacterium]
MVRLAPWKVVLILAVCFYGFVYSSPNLLSPDARLWVSENMPGWFPQKTVNLGLDLRGGAHLLYQVAIDKVFAERADSMVQSVRDQLRDAKIGYGRIGTVDKGLTVTLKDAANTDALKKILRKEDSRLLLDTSDDGLTVTAKMDAAMIKEVEDQTIAQVIEVVRRRVDALGTTEPVIQRQGMDRVIIQAPGASSEDLRRLVGKTAKLGFHLVGTPGERSPGERTLPFAEDAQRKISIKRRAIISGDMLTGAQPSFDQQGRAVVSFKLNSEGARKFCDVTRNHVNDPFAIVLDDQIISAPVINEPICGGQGQISGGFDVQGATDLALLLRAGALPADLTVVEERTVGPSLGADSIAAGKMASLIGLALVLGFMLMTYGSFGLMADVALMVNVALIMALLSSLQATLTLPGIAGIVLTIGMAVDANVLIFERIREENRAGRSLIASIDSGYNRAMSTIIDSNLTTLIAAAILFSFGSGPVKGFAVTMVIGIVTSFFSAIMVTRMMVLFWLERRKKTSGLPF